MRKLMILALLLLVTNMCQADWRGHGERGYERPDWHNHYACYPVYRPVYGPVFVVTPAYRPVYVSYPVYATPVYMVPAPCYRHGFVFSFGW